MRSYSQNAEDVIVWALFKGFKGTLLEIGANNGQTLSNSKLLIENGFSGHLVEPGHTFNALSKSHKKNDKVKCYNYAIGGLFETEMSFYESGAHVKGGNDTGLVSTLDFEETERWRRNGVQFTERKVAVKPFSHLYRDMGKPMLDFISIDAEGHDWDILQQIDLNMVGCKVLIIEWNGDQDLLKKFTDYCANFRLVDKNNENLIFSKI